MKRFSFAIIVCVSVFSCDILRDGIFEVSHWSPGEGYFDPALVTEISLDFSLEPDRNSVERSFTLTENGRALPGHFTWQDRRMIFTPSVPLAANKDYCITLKTDAQDTRGLSLERQFERAFTTRNGGMRPLLLASVPEDGGIIEIERGKVTLIFSEPVTRNSLQSLSFSPSISGAWSLEQDGHGAVFTPLENWTNGRVYRLTVGTALQDKTELEAGRSYAVHFTAGTDYTPPELISASAIDADGNTAFVLTAADGTAAENSGWERNCRLSLVFSEPVDSTSVNSALSCEPSLGMTAEAKPGYSDTFIFRFSEPPVYGASYTLTLRQSVRDKAGNTMGKNIVWHILADGENSRPPVLRGLRFPKKPGSTSDLLTFTTENQFADFPVGGDSYAFDTGISVWMELYFETAPGAVIDLLSLMDRFRFNATNSALSFSPRSIIDSSFSAASPAPGWERYHRVEIRGVLTNYPYMGMVTIETTAGLKDSFGNKSAEAFRFLLLK
ncbi:MAG: Ig-like domain-containing protein [Spirochaetaceae bacterium]|jgi:hypothetical protein|nr:Ig-like domain-containing protein [Spirochaetaceae bacterium]